MAEVEQEIWAFLERHLQSIFTRDVATYRETTAEELSLYEWYITPHRQDGLDFHLFMIEEGGVDRPFRFDMLERRLQLYGDTAVASYALMFSVAHNGQIVHNTHNESRVLVRRDGSWQVVHVHKSPGWRAPYDAKQ